MSEAARVDGFTLWLHGEGGVEAMEAASSQIARALAGYGLPVETIDTVREAKRAYRERIGSLGLVIGYAASRLNRHGVVVVAHGARNPSSVVRWGREKPERLLDIVCLEAEPDEGSRAESDDAAEEVPVKLVPDGGDAGKTEPGSTDPVLDSLKERGWLNGEGGEATSSEDEDEALIRRRLQQLGYL